LAEFGGIFIEKSGQLDLEGFDIGLGAEQVSKLQDVIDRQPYIAWSFQVPKAHLNNNVIFVA
jgi:hypothetical protein